MEKYTWSLSFWTGDPTVDTPFKWWIHKKNQACRDLHPVRCYTGAMLYPIELPSLLVACATETSGIKSPSVKQSWNPCSGLRLCTRIGIHSMTGELKSHCQDTNQVEGKYIIRNAFQVTLWCSVISSIAVCRSG